MRPRHSYQAEAVAKDLMEKIQTGQKVNLKQIQKDHGYSERSAHSMKVKTTQTFQKMMGVFQASLEAEIMRIAQELAGRDLSKEKYKDLAEVLDKLNKQLNLAKGGSTERMTVTLQLSETIAKKNNLDIVDSNVVNALPESDS